MSPQPGSTWSGLATAPDSADVCTGDADAQRIEAFERLERVAYGEESQEDMQAHRAQLRRIFEGLDPEIALGIQTPPGGGHSVRTLVGIARRNRAIREALEILAGRPIARIERKWNAAGRLCNEIKRFEIEWRRHLCEIGEAPDTLAPLDQALFRAFSAAPRGVVPTGDKAVAKICFPDLPTFRK